MTPFIVYAMPRSRSYWLSRFLTYGDWVCGHDEVRHVRSLDDVRSWFSQPFTGTVETAAAPFWRLLTGIRTVILYRPVSEVVDSLERLSFDRDQMTKVAQRAERKLEQIAARVPGALWIETGDLANEDGAKLVFEHCLSHPLDTGWWSAMNAVNMQTSMLGARRYMRAHAPQLNRVALAAKSAMLSAIAKRGSSDMDGMTFQQESWDRFFVDGSRLFEANSSAAGSGTAYFEKNLPLMRMMAQAGSLQITTARCNGRMFGYVLSAVAPSMESEDTVSALHVLSYASPDVRGLGLKMSRAANEALRDRGVSEVRYRVGDEQKKLGAFYRRLGARHCGEEYVLRLN